MLKSRKLKGHTWNVLYLQGWAEVSDRFSNRCGLKLVHATPIKFKTLNYQRVLCLFWKFEAFIFKQNWFMIKKRIHFLFQKIEFSTLNFFRENQMFFKKKFLNIIHCSFLGSEETVMKWIVKMIQQWLSEYLKYNSSFLLFVL